MPALVPSGNSPSSTMPSTLAASARSISRPSLPSPPGVTTPSATTPRACAAATSSGVGAFSRRQLTGVPTSSSSDCASAHGQRTGTHAAGGGAAAHNKGTRPKAAPQRPARIHITLEYDIPVAAELVGRTPWTRSSLAELVPKRPAIGRPGGRPRTGASAPPSMQAPLPPLHPPSRLGNPVPSDARHPPTRAIMATEVAMRRLAILLALWIPATTQAAPMLNLVVVEGEGATNNIRQRTARAPVVQVEDENNKPVAGAIVVFTVPSSGGGGAFSNGVRTLTMVSDSKGQAVAEGFRPNGLKGQFKIHVNASFQGQTANTEITQTNAALTSSGTIA